MKDPKIKRAVGLARILKKAKSAGRIIGFTNGCFDILHVGHVKYLKEARGGCDILVVGVNSDSSVRRLKGKTRPINHQDARAEVLASLECVDYVTLFTQDTPLKLIRTLGPDVLFKGGDWKEKDVVGGKYVKMNGGRVMIIPYVKGYSTTATIKRMKKKD